MKNIKTYFQILAVVVVASTAYFFIYINRQSENGIELYITDIFNALMGAFVLAMVTASIFMFQRRIESDDEKKRAIYDKKLELYEDLAKKLNEIIKDKKVSEEELSELQSDLFKIILIAGPKSGQKFYDMLVSLGSDTGPQIDKENLKTILEFVVECRQDLEVLANIDSGQKQELEKFLQEIIKDELMVENITGGKKRKFTAEHRRRVVASYDSASSPEEKDAVLKREKLYPVQIKTFRRWLEKNENKIQKN